jgi:hypothetical protein
MAQSSTTNRSENLNYNRLETVGRLKSVGISTIQLLVAAAFLGLALIGCQPKDEKVSTRRPFTPRTNSNTGTPAELGFEDRSLEYSRSMLAELNLIAGQVENTLAASRKAVAANTAGGQLDLFSEPSVEVVETPAEGTAPAKPACRTSREFNSPEGTLELMTETKDCKDKGQEFEAQSFGREIAFVVLGAKNERPFVKAMRVQSKGMDTNLRPLSNPKDSLKARFFRFLDVRYVGSEGEFELYRFFYESEGNYFLNLKAFTDDGVIRTKQSGVLVVDALSGKVQGFRATEKSDRFDLTVESNRKCRSCTNNTARQEFRASAVVSSFELNLEQCQLPKGLVEARFTIKDLNARDKKYSVDVTSKLESTHELVRNLAKGDAETRSKVSSATCAADKSLSPSEFFSGLLY